MKYFAFILFAVTLNAQLVSDDSTGDDHAGFPASKRAYQSNTVAFVQAHLNVTNDVFGSRAGFIGIITRHGDCVEDDRPLTTGIGTAVYSGQELTNDYRIFSQSGAMFFINDGNHDANNTNNPYGTTYYTHPYPTNLWNDMFPPTFWTNQTLYFYTNWPPSQYNNMAMKYETNRLKLLYISVHTESSTNSENDGSYTNQMEQIRAVMRANPDYNVILKMHFALGQSTNSYWDIVPSFKDHATTYSNYSIGPGKSFLRVVDEPNFLGVTSGHNVPLWKGIYIATNRLGNPWFVVQFNTQSSGQNGDWHSVLTYNWDKFTVEFNTFSVSQNRWLTDYELAGGNVAFTNMFFVNGFKQTGKVALPVRPRQYLTK